MQRRNDMNTTTGRARARGVSWEEQDSYERDQASKRKDLKAKVATRRPDAPPPRKKQTKGGALDSGYAGGTLRAISGLTKDKGRSYKV